MIYKKGYIEYIEAKDYSRLLLLSEKQKQNTKIIMDTIEYFSDNTYENTIQLLDLCIDNNYDYNKIEELLY